MKKRQYFAKHLVNESCFILSLAEHETNSSLHEELIPMRSILTHLKAWSVHDSISRVKSSTSTVSPDDITCRRAGQPAMRREKLLQKVHRNITDMNSLRLVIGRRYMQNTNRHTNWNYHY